VGHRLQAPGKGVANPAVWVVSSLLTAAAGLVVVYAAGGALPAVARVVVVASLLLMASLALGATLFMRRLSSNLTEAQATVREQADVLEGQSKKLDQRASRDQLLTNVQLTIGQELSLTATFESCVAAISRLLPADWIALFAAPHSNGQQGRMAGEWTRPGVNQDDRPLSESFDWEPPPGEGPASEIVQVDVDDRSTTQLGVLVKATGIRRIAAVTLRFKGQWIGTLRVGRAGRSPFEEEALEALNAVGRQLSSTLANVRLFRIVENSKRDWERTFDVMLDLIMVIDSAGRIQRVNRAMAARLGAAPAALVKRPVEEALAGCHEAFTAPALTGAESPRRAIEATCSVLGGTFEITNLTLLDEEGQPSRILRIGRDITERKALAEQVAQGEKMAAIGLMAAGIAHEVNNPVAYMLANLNEMAISVDHIESFARMMEGAANGDEVRDLARKEKIDEVLRELRTMIEESHGGGIRIRDIVRGLTAFSRKETNPERMPMDVIEVVEQVLRMTQHEVRIRCDVVRDFAPVPLVFGERGKLSQVVLNLVVNAVQAMEGAGERDRDRPHSLTLRTKLTADRQVALEISDTGSGIAPAHLGNIFDPFFTTKDVGRGTGLGLSVASQIIKNHGGAIRVVSALGVGTTFTVELPRAEGEEVEVTTPTIVAAASHQGPRGRILVVDDEPILLRSYRRLLGRHHDVVVAGSGREALEILVKDIGFDAILCDLMMLDLPGSDLYDIVRGRWPQLGEAFVFLTGGRGYPEVAAFLSRISNLALDKPTSEDALLAAIRERVEQVAAAQPGSARVSSKTT